MKFKVFFDFTLVDPNTSCFTGKSGYTEVTTEAGNTKDILMVDPVLLGAIRNNINNGYKRKKVFSIEITKVEELTT